MHQIGNEVKTFYLENPEMLAEREFVTIQMLEDYLKDHDLMRLAPEAFARWEHTWKIAKSYWTFPDEDDMKKMVDEIYKKYEISKT